MNIEINGVNLQADFMDADFMETFEPAMHKLLDDIGRNKTQKRGCVAAGYKELNICIENFFDAVWGEGTSDCIFNGSKNVMVHLGAVAQVEEASRVERKQFNDVSNKYIQRQKQNGIQSMQGHQKPQKPRNKHT